MPIAQQLGTQTYLSQIQDKLKDLEGYAQNAPPSELEKKFAGVSHNQPEEVVEKPENKMEAFFRQAEEDKLKKSQAQQSAVHPEPVAEAHDYPNNDLEDDIETGAEATSENESLEVPVFQLPPVIQSPTQQPIASALSESPDSHSPETLAEELAGLFRGNSSNSAFNSPASEQVDLSTQLNPSGSALPPTNDIETSANQDGASGVDPVAPTQPETGSRRMTGTAGLSAAMAVTGMGSLGAQLAEQTTSSSQVPATPVPPRPASAMSDFDDPSDLLRQQIADERQEEKSRRALAPQQLPNTQPMSAPPFNRPTTPDASLAPSPTASQTIAGATNVPVSQPPADVETKLPPLQNDDAEDARLAAKQQAERIIAERTRELASEAPASANRADAGRERQSVLPPPIPSQPPALVQSAQPPSTISENIKTEGAPVEPQRRRDNDAPLPVAASSPEPASAQRLAFPMELFNLHLVKNLRNGVVFLDHQRRVQLWSKGAETMTGIVPEAVIDRPLYPQTFNLRFEDGTGVSLEDCPISKCLETMRNVSGDYRTLNADNQEVKIAITISPVIDENRSLNGAIIIFDDHSVEIDLQRQLKDLYAFSMLDSLTQVANRAEFERVLEEYVSAFTQSDAFNCSIIICDIDFFKSINDNFGHAVGDQALVSFAEMLKKYVRTQDLVARYGGEEFVILCADCDTDSARQRAEKIRMALCNTPQPMLGGKAISASFGVSELRQGDTAMEFFVRADTALLKAKELGRNRVVIADQQEASRDVETAEAGGPSGMKWRQQRRAHTALLSEEFKTTTPVVVLVEKLRGFIIEKDAWLQRIDQEFLSMDVDFEDPRNHSRKGSFTLNIEFKEAEEDVVNESRRQSFIRITIFPGRKKKWFSTNHTDVAPYLLSELRCYLMINDKASHLALDMATENVRDSH